MTRFEQIASAFPLHAQRIAEATHQCEGAVEGGLEYLFAELHDDWDAGLTLASLFYWSDTPEGHNYWRRLADRALSA